MKLVHHYDPENSGILPQRIIGTKEIQNQSLCWKFNFDCILELRRCAHWLPGERCYSELWMLYWNTKNTEKVHHNKGGRNGWCLASTRQCQASHRCHHNWCHCTFKGLQCYLIQPTAQISLLHISCCSPNCRETSGARTSALMKKSRLQYSCSFRIKGNTKKGWTSKTC